MTFYAPNRAAPVGDAEGVAAGSVVAVAGWYPWVFGVYVVTEVAELRRMPLPEGWVSVAWCAEVMLDGVQASMLAGWVRFEA